MLYLTDIFLYVQYVEVLSFVICLLTLVMVLYDKQISIFIELSLSIFSFIASEF